MSGPDAPERAALRGVLGRSAVTAWRAATWAGTATAVVLAAHAAANTRCLLRPAAGHGVPAVVDERVSVLVPARDEVATLPALVADLRAQRGVPRLEVLVLDDRSSDGTAEAARQAADGDPRVRVLSGEDPPPGWLGKPHACDRLAAAATGSVLVFVDADVRLRPDALAATVGLLRRHDLAVLSPYPRQLAVTPAERLAQPLLAWSWLTTIPLGWARRSRRPSLSAANGQFLAVDADAYRACGGHAAVRSRVLEDIALMRAVKAAGGRGVPADGSRVASCRMYTSWPEVRDGYAKSLWEAFGSRTAAAAVMAVLAVTYVVPAVAAVGGSAVGAVGYAAGVAGRAVAAETTGSRTWPDALAHPVSVALAGWLTAVSWRRRGRGTLTWKGRVLP